MLVIFFVCHYFFICGGTYLAALEWSHFSWLKYKSGPDKDKLYIQFDGDKHKTRRCTLKSPVLIVEDWVHKLRQEKNNPLDPCTLITILGSLTPKENPCIWCFLKLKKNTACTKTTVPVINCLSIKPRYHIVETKLGAITKALAHLCGFKNPEKCTNHGNKA